MKGVDFTDWNSPPAYDGAGFANGGPDDPYWQTEVGATIMAQMLELNARRADAELERQSVIAAGKATHLPKATSYGVSNGPPRT